MPQNQQLAEELHKSIIKKFKERKVYSSFKDNIWGADLADMQSTIKFNNGFRFLLCVIDICSKYAWAVPLKDKKGATIVNAFQSILKDSNRKPNKVWVDRGNEFCNNSFKKWLQDNDIVMYIDKLDNIVNEYNNTYHRTTKMKSIDAKTIHILILIKKLKIKILNFKFAII